jgi:hypothetical protein
MFGRRQLAELRRAMAVTVRAGKLRRSSMNIGRRKVAVDGDREMGRTQGVAAAFPDGQRRLRCGVGGIAHGRTRTRGTLRSRPIHVCVG